MKIVHLTSQCSVSCSQDQLCSLKPFLFSSNLYSTPTSSLLDGESVARYYSKCSPVHFLLSIALAELEPLLLLWLPFGELRLSTGIVRLPLQSSAARPAKANSCTAFDPDSCLEAADGSAIICYRLMFRLAGCTLSFWSPPLGCS